MPEKSYTLSELQEMHENLGNFIANQTISERSTDMGTEKRRVIIGWSDSGSPVRKQLMAKNMDEMNDKIVKEYVASGRIYDFLPKVQQTQTMPENFTLTVYSKKWLTRKRKLKQTTRANYQKYIDKINNILGDRCNSGDLGKYSFGVPRSHEMV